MTFTPQFGKSTSLSADMSISETASATLASAAFTNFTNDYLVIDYNVPASREVIKCTVTGTAISSITRAQQGTSAIAHSSGALVAYNFLPIHYGNGLGKIADNDAWTAYTPTLTNITIGNGTNTAAYFTLGKIYFAHGKLTWGSTTSSAGVFQLSTGATMLNALVVGSALVLDSTPGNFYLASVDLLNTTTMTFHNNLTTQAIAGNYATPFTWGSGDTLTWSVIGEIA